MFTDMVGYTALTERDETAALRARTHQRDLIQRLVSQFDGQVIEATGDESLSVFPSALRAVDGALALQEALKTSTDLRLRIGIHLGDVVRRDGEIVGEGVNVAARIRPLAEPGGICISEPVYQMVRSRAHVKARALGPQSFKNVSAPVGVYALAVSESEAAPRRRVRGLPSLAAALLLLVAAGIAALNRDSLSLWFALNVPRFFGNPIEQTLGVARTSDGVGIAYATTGQGPAIVFVLGWATHIEGGFGSPLYDAAGLLPISSARHTFVRFDGRGFGLSDRDVSDFSVDARVRDIEAVVDALRLERFQLYAASAGGFAAIAYTARHPERVTRLVLASTQVSYAYMTPEVRERFERMLALFETDWEVPAVSNVMAELLAPTDADVERDMLGEFLRRSGSGPNVAGFLRANLEIDVSDEARTIRIPTLVIHGRDDTIVPVEAARTMAALIPGARFEIVEGGHQEGAGLRPSSRARILSFFDEEPPS